MSTPPTNPFPPSPDDKGPWIYSGMNAPAPGSNIPMPTAQPTPTPAPAPSGPPPLPPLPTTTFSNPFGPKKPTDAKPDDGSLASIVDTIEAIIIALILALTFRAFIVEAFVIPTGSMAPTLLGAHFNVVCPKCGYTFTRETSLAWQRVGNQLAYMGNRAELSDNRAIPSDQTVAGRGNSEYIFCPNCTFAIDPSQLPQRLKPLAIQTQGNAPPRTLNFAWTNNGDRILVLKYLYTAAEPHRFDVIVFKEPLQGRENYIKRLIGLPGETIEIINGDIFVGPPGKSDPRDLQIARKPAHVQRALWQLVYDNDFYPRDEGAGRDDGTVWTNPWAGSGNTAAAWDNHETKTVFHYTAASAGTLKFDGREPYGFNILGYDNDIPLLATTERGRTLLRATDLRVETVWTPQTADAASLAMSAGQPSNLYRFQWSSQGLALSHFNVTTQAYEPVTTLDSSQVPAPTPGRAYRVALDNVDRTTRVWIDDKVVLEHKTPWTAADALADMPRQQHDSMDNVRPVVAIDVGGPCQIGHLKLFRDLYYTQTPNGTDLSNYAHTANAETPLTLGPDEYFPLGDNSRDSLDGRMWNSVNPSLDDIGTRRGIVPKRYLLGKAFFVYWPAGFRPDASDSIPSSLNIPLVPNAGDMRLIR